MRGPPPLTASAHRLLSVSSPVPDPSPPPPAPVGATDTSREALWTPAVREAAAVIRQAVDAYGVPALSLSFNGGKDCVVLLDLLSVVLGPAALRQLYTFTFSEPDSFPELTEFAIACCKQYGLQLDVLTYDNFQAGLAAVGRRGVKGTLVGTRRADPHGATLAHMTPTTPGWPPMMRIHPILEWGYADVWQYIAARAVPVCGLYARGYTSIGSVHNTIPNPHLLIPGTRPPAYRHARELQDGALERAGRIESKL
eukprot:EG_transcript_17261